MRIGLYPRVSTSEQAENGNSLNEQIDRMKKYCESYGWTVYRIYTDAGFSGGTMDRPGLQALIRDVKQGLLDKVLVYKLDRLSRSQKDTLSLIEDVFLANGTDFISMTENFDTASPLGRAMIGILAVFAQLEREQIKERMRMGKEAVARQGKFTGGRNIPIGYVLKDGEYIPDPFEKLQVIEAYHLAEAGKTSYAIAKIFTEKGYRNKNGRWTTQSVQRVLTSKTYIGYKKFNGEWHKGHHETFISDELFQNVQQIIGTRATDHNRHNRRQGRASSYLGGFLYCAKCGAKYSIKPAYYMRSGQKICYRYFICKTKSEPMNSMARGSNCDNKNWNEKALTSLVFAEIRKLALDPEYSIVSAGKPQEPQMSSVLRAEIKKLDDQISKLIDLYTLGDIPSDILQDRIRSANEQKIQLEASLSKEEQQESETLTREESIELARSFSDILDRGDFSEIRMVLSALIEKITIDNEDVTIFWKFS